MSFIDRFVTYHLPEVSSLYRDGIFSLANQSSEYGTSTRAGSVYEKFDHSYIVKRGDLINDEYWHGKEGTDPLKIEGNWVEVILDKIWVIPHSYIIVDSSNLYRVMNWDFLASQDGINYDMIDSKYVPTLFTQKWQIEPFNVPQKIIRFRKPYRYFRLKLNRQHNPGHPAFRLGRFEIFGEVAFCNQECNNPPKFPRLLTCLMKQHIHLHSFLFFFTLAVK